MKQIKTKGVIVVFVMLIAMSSLTLTPFTTAEASLQKENPFIRAFWVQAFEPGLKTPEEIDELVKDVDDANMNTIIAQVSRRHDAYYYSDVLPFTEDPSVPEGFDPLGYLLTKAHEKGIEVHAWVVVGPMWHSVYGGAPSDPTHIWNLHGPDAVEDKWVTEDYNGTVPYWQPYLDLGHPDARNHVVEMVNDIARNYEVDGVHLDYIRYPEDGKGYNATSLARFHEETGRSDRPTVNDQEWIAWKVEQIDSLIKRVYTELMTVDADVELTAAVLSWGFHNPSKTNWWDMDPVQRAHQNWKEWVQEGYLDYAYVMNYDSDADPRRAIRYDQWIEWQKDLPRNRGIIIGPALYLNTISDSMDQIHRALAPSVNGNMAEGVSPYVYNIWSNDGLPQSSLIKSLYLPTEHNEGRPPFEIPTKLPDPSWRQGNHGHLLGQLATEQSAKEVILRRGKNGKIIKTLETDANGYFVITDLSPGNYFIHNKNSEERTKVQIKKQHVTEILLKD
ncbi:glycoside hydrolase family 10 protein [Oceanobacillus kimchii]|uniref:glycoside hydrolase family 10 protein n=1 Tax=Oceanobacillus kimchii TaxID=746691 RepID=UPI000346B8B3|nr:family 10 glycosylhydrolase [Oceanobacillus kimchii]